MLFVLLSHASKHFPVVHPAFNFRGAGKFGVYLFFLLSAYLLDRQIALAIRRGERNYWGNYFLRRVLRVYPLFAFALVVHLLLNRAGITTVIETWRDVAAHLMLLEGKGVFWSIPVEMMYYLVSPVIMIICGLVLCWRPVLVYGFLAGLIAAAAWLSASGWLPPGTLVDYLPIFLMGAIIAVHEVLAPPRRVEADLLAEEASGELHAALGKLEATTREMILLRHFGQMSFKEIAELFDCPLGTALARVHRGLRALRELMRRNAPD